MLSGSPAYRQPHGQGATGQPGAEFRVGAKWMVDEEDPCASALRDAGLPQDAALVAALNDYRDYTRFFDRLIGQVVSAGAASRSALVVAAAGNDSHGDSQPPYRIGATLPAVAEKVLSVGAVAKGVGDLFDLAPFSNTGVDLCAPGVAIRSSLPGGRYGAMTGTSQVAPHVAALAVNKRPRVTPPPQIGSIA